MTKKIPIPRASIGYAYVGLWRDGDVGWHGVRHVTGDRHTPEATSPGFNKYAKKGTRAYLCKVILIPVLDSKGRPITRKATGKPGPYDG